jgi:rhamnosyltransferase
MRILVLLASYNGAEFIEEQIHSILNQEGVSVDILISDDKSRDDTIFIAEKLISQGHPIKLIRRSTSSGSAGANFMGMIGLVENPANYDAFAFSDQDDIWMPKKLITALSSLVKHQADLYVSNLLMWNQLTGEKNLIKKSYPQKKYDFLFEGGSAGCTYLFTPILFEVIKREVTSIHLSSWVGFSHDWFVYFLARINKFNVHIDENACVLYRIHSSNVHGHLNETSLNSFITRFRLVREGWYLNHIDHFIKFFSLDSPEYKIYSRYRNGWASRIYVLAKYNLQLMRSPLKFIMFFLVSCVPVKR